MMDRCSWSEYFIGLARAASLRATCDRAHVGCVIVRDHRVLVTGYNGSVSGDPHCDDVGHLLIDGHCQRTVHAESNAIAQAARHSVSLKGSVAYVTHSPCFTCCKLLISAGVNCIVYDEAYRLSPETTYMCDRLGIGLVAWGDR
jgi:dCMP deaminase